MSVYREEGMRDGSIVNRGMTEEDWRRLHGRVLPNQLSLNEFKQVITDGKVHDAYLGRELHKIMQEMRDILKEHGELRAAAQLPLTGRKADMGKAAATAVCFLNSGRALTVGPAPLPAAPSSAADAAAVVAAPQESVYRPSLADLRRSPHRSLNGGPSGPADGAIDSTVTKGSIAKPSRTLPITDHIHDSAFDPYAPLTDAPQAGSPPAADGGHGHPSGHNRSWSPNRELIRRVALNASASAPLPANGTGMTAAGESPENASTPMSSSVHALVTPATTGVKNELAALNERSPPFAQVINVVRRFQLRYGTHPIRFEVPVQYAQAVATRRLRVQIIPLRHPNVPARWPVAKEMVVYVNDQCVTTPWRRAWPERKEEVAKTYLPLDITQFVNRSQAQQRIQIDVFNRDYFTPALLVVVQPFSLDDVVDSLLRRELGEGQLSRVRAALLAPDMSSILLSENDTRMNRFYQRVMEDDAEEGLEVDDPVITTKCPISQMPIGIPVRGRDCGHLQCVDLTSYLVSCHKGSYWNCALCDCELRPAAITVDTVLWRFLLTAAAGSGSLPHHLRLSCRPGGDAAEAGASALSHYFWHPSRGGPGDDADYLVDDEDGEGEGSSDALRDGNDDREQMQAKIEQLQSIQEPRDWDAAASAGRVAGLKRPRASPSQGPEGTADDPIEL